MDNNTFMLIGENYKSKVVAFTAYKFDSVIISSYYNKIFIALSSQVNVLYNRKKRYGRFNRPKRFLKPVRC